MVPIHFPYTSIQKIVSMIRKYHNHKLQTTPWHREEEPLNHHKTPGRQIKQRNQLSLPHQTLWPKDHFISASRQLASVAYACTKTPYFENQIKTIPCIAFWRFIVAQRNWPSAGYGTVAISHKNLQNSPCA